MAVRLTACGICGAKHYARGFCRRHYDRARKRNDWTAQPRPTTEQNFWRNVVETTDCWLWTAAADRYGYGVLGVAGRTVRAHRYAYELLVGPIAPGLDVGQICRNRRCVRPSHLVAGTRAVTLRRGLRWLRQR